MTWSKLALVKINVGVIAGVFVLGSFSSPSLSQVESVLQVKPQALVEKLVGELASDSYVIRTNASKQLADLGTMAVPILAKSIVQRDPETRAACLRILSAMDISADDAATFRAALIIQTLADKGYPRLKPKVNAIGQAWRVTKVKQNIELLEEAGAKVIQNNAVSGGRGDFAIREVFSAGSIAFDSASSETPDHVESTDQQINSSEFLEAIDEILEQSEESVSDLFVERVAAESTPKNATPPNTHTVIVGGRAREIIVHTTFDSVAVGQAANSLISSIEIDENWKGRPEDYQLLKVLPSVPQIQLNKVTIDKTMLDAFSRIPNLYQITITGCEFELQDLIDFRRSNPNVNILSMNKAFLGITGDVQGVTNEGCTISSVVDDTAASRAGLRVGDVIQAIAGAEVKNFEDLRLTISTLEPDANVKIKIKRGEEEMELDVTLGATAGALPID